MPDDNEAENVPDDNQNESPQHANEHDTEDDEEKPTTDAERDPEEYDGDTRRSRKKEGLLQAQDLDQHQLWAVPSR